MIEEDIIFPHARLSRAPDIQPRTAPMEVRASLLRMHICYEQFADYPRTNCLLATR